MFPSNYIRSRDIDVFSEVRGKICHCENKLAKLMWLPSLTFAKYLGMFKISIDTSLLLGAIVLIGMKYEL